MYVDYLFLTILTFRLNIALNCSDILLNISCIDVLFPINVADIFKPLGGISHTATFTLFGIHSTKYLKESIY